MPEAPYIAIALVLVFIAVMSWRDGNEAMRKGQRDWAYALSGIFAGSVVGLAYIALKLAGAA